MACTDTSEGRIFISSQMRSPAGSGTWSNSIAHGIICYRGPCPAQTKTLSFQGSKLSNWTHFFTLEDNGSFRVVTTKYNPNHNPRFSIFSENDLRHGDNYLEYLRFTDTGSGKSYDFYLDYLLNSEEKTIAISHRYEEADDPATMSTPFPHGVLAL